MSLDPTIVQPLPKTEAANNTDVGEAVIKFLTDKTSPNYFPSVAHDHESRISFGEKKYGQRLKVNNGRDAGLDSLEELLDFLSYAMQANLEGRTEFLDLFYKVAKIANTVRELLIPF